MALWVRTRPAFARLSQMAALVRDEVPDADVISAGMSQDLEVAVIQLWCDTYASAQP